MTFQRKVHKYKVECDKIRKKCLRHKGVKESSKVQKVEKRNRKWWSAWHKTWEYNFEKENNNG